jgi:hypothetical protein
VSITLTQPGQRFGLSPRVAVLLFSLLLAGALFGVSASPAYACRCAPQTPAEQYSRAQVAFVGTVTRLEYFFDSPDGSRTSAPIRWQWATFGVSETWKGIGGSSATVRIGGTEGASCGFDLLKGATYLVMASPHGDGSLLTSACHGTTELSDTVRETYELARGSPPTVSTQVTGAPAPAAPAPLARARASGVSEEYARSGTSPSDPRITARNESVELPLLGWQGARWVAPLAVFGVLVFGLLAMVLLSKGRPPA